MQIWLIFSLTGVTRWLAIRSGLWSLRRFCCQFFYFVYHQAWPPDVYLWCLIVFHFFAASHVGFCSRYVWYHFWYQDQDTLFLRVVRVWQYTTPQLDSALFSILRSASYPQSKLTRFQNFSIFPTTRKDFSTLVENWQQFQIWFYFLCLSLIIANFPTQEILTLGICGGRDTAVWRQEEI